MQMNSVYLVILTFFLTFIGATSNPAQASDIFTVNNIEVNGQGETAKLAKDNAIAVGEEYAFKQLLRLIATSPEETWPQLNAEELADLIQGFDIQKEKVTAKHYEATLNISFNQALIEKLLKDSKVNYVTKRSEPVVILPLFISPGSNLLWESSNLWNNAWKKSIATNGFTQFVIPKGDDKDMEAVSPEKLLTKNYPTEQKDKDIITGLMNKYFSKKLLLAKASQSKHDGITEITVDLTYLNNDQSENSSIKVQGQAGDTIDVVMEKAVAEIIGNIEKKWKQNQATSQADSSQINVNIAISSMEEWNRLKKRLSGFDFIKSLNTKYLTVSYASIDIHFQGSYSDLVSHLESKGLYIETRNNSLFLSTTPSSNPSSSWLQQEPDNTDSEIQTQGWQPNDPEDPKRKVNDNEL
jgi:hypothetical protein